VNGAIVGVVTGRARLLGGGAAAIGALTLVLYLALIVNEGDDGVLEVAPWALAMAVASAAAAAGAVAARRRLVALGGVVFLVTGLPAIFSVGLPLLVAGLLCLLASRPSSAPGRGSTFGHLG
jgi:drug/metabolite transporter (DMT)-like permease